MLGTIWTTTALYSKSDIDYSIKAYQRQLRTIMSYQFNTEVLPPMYLYNKIIDLTAKIENLMILKNVLMSAFSLLKDNHKDIIRTIYFDAKTKEDAILELNLTDSQYKYIKRVAVKKMSFLLNMLGISTERFIELFNEEPLIVRCYEECLALNNKTNHLRRVDNARF